MLALGGLVLSAVVERVVALGEKIAVQETKQTSTDSTLSELKDGQKELLSSVRRIERTIGSKPR